MKKAKNKKGEKNNPGKAAKTKTVSKKSGMNTPEINYYRRFPMMEENFFRLW